MRGEDVKGDGDLALPSSLITKNITLLPYMVQEEVGSFHQYDCSGQLLVVWGRTAREKATLRITWVTSTNPPKAKERGLWS